MILALAICVQTSASVQTPAFETHHRVKVRGETIRYTALAGPTKLTNLGGDPIGEIFSFTYLKEGKPEARRPVMFVFNGGPGSSSIWLHMGVVGPRRVVLDREVDPSPVPPFRVEDNPDCLLDVADLVFIDPVGTGFSRILGKGRPEDFFGVDEDADSIAQFIERWLTKHGRWDSPKFLMGESYGSARAALLPRALMGGRTYTGQLRGITVDGIVLLGTTMESPANPVEEDERLARVSRALPSLAATAWYHGRVKPNGRTSSEFGQEVTRFASESYLPALRKAKAGSLTEAERGAVVNGLADYTGLSPQSVPSNLEVSASWFAPRLLADRGLSVGLYDGRYTLPTAHAGGEPVADDPAMARYTPAFVAGLQRTLRDDLRVEMDRPYAPIVWKDLLFGWNWERSTLPEGTSFAHDLATAMRRNERLRVLVASGTYDLVTTATEANHALRAAGIPEDRTTYRTYESGHMLYLGATARPFSDDVRDLVRKAVRPGKS